MINWMLRGMGILFGLVLIYFLIHFDLVFYGINQLKGQVKILREARPIVEVLDDPLTPDSVRIKIKLIQEIRDFGIKTLGLKDSPNYQSYYDQQGKPVLWIVTACPEFSLQPIEWDFALAGKFPYKGFFDFEKARAAYQEMHENGFDADLSPVEGWSTLGFFSDPILSEMLKRSEGGLANLILHELTHSTVFFRDSTDFNENFATLVGSLGSRAFLEKKYNRDHDLVVQYIENQNLKEIWSRTMAKASLRLDSLYSSFGTELAIPEKRKRKRKAIMDIARNWNKAMEKYPDYQFPLDSMEHVNNAWFASFSRYHGGLEKLEDQLMSQFHGDLKAMIEFYGKGG